MANPQNSNGPLANIISAGSRIIGTVFAENDIRLDGTIEGDLKCNGKVLIGEKGQLKGDIVCQNADIQGKLDGKLDVKQTLALRSTARLEGNVNTQVLIVEPNAIFNGNCTMGKPSGTPTAQPHPATPEEKK